MPFFLLFLPVDYFDSGESICPSKRFFDIECLGCGLTRGVMHLLHMDFVGAWEFNFLSYPIVLIGVLVWFHILGKLINRPIFTWMNKLY